jgi:hypothetical protein
MVLDTGLALSLMIVLIVEISSLITFSMLYALLSQNNQVLVNNLCNSRLAVENLKELLEMF